MWVKICKKPALVLTAVLLLASAAIAAPSNSALLGGRTEESEYTKTIPGKLEVTFKGLWKLNNVLEAHYTAVSPSDRRVSAETRNSVLKDANDVEISLKNYGERLKTAHEMPNNYTKRSSKKNSSNKFADCSTDRYAYQRQTSGNRRI